MNRRALAVAALSFFAFASIAACKGEPAAPSKGSGSGGGPGVNGPDPVPMLEPGDDPAEVLGKPAAMRDYGEPAPMDDKVLALARDVMTDPGDIPRLKVAVDGKKLELPLKHTHVSAAVTGYVARVEVTQTYQNPFPEPIEAVYVFPLPENSAVDDMKIRIGERLIEAEIKKRAEARRVYEEAKQQGHTAALLEQERPNIFTQSIANMEPGVEIEVVIRYVQDLSYDAGEYEFVFPMVVGPRFIPGQPNGGASGTGWAQDTDAVPDASRITPPIIGGGQRTGHDISLELAIDAGLPITDFAVPTHDIEASDNDGVLIVELADHDSIPNRDFVMRYRVGGDEPQADVMAHKDKRGGFFALMLQPPKLDRARIDELVGKRELIFVVDISGSMWGVPLGMCKDAMRQAIRMLRPSDTFNVITFAGATAKAFPEARPANDTNIRDALEFILDARAGGGTMLANAVDEALRPEVPPDRHRHVFFLTDGYVGNEREIHAAVEGFVRAHEAAGRRSKAFAMGTGSSVNRHLLDGIAKAGRGVAVYTTNREDPTRAVNQFYRYIDSPVLSDINIDWGDLEVVDVYPEVLGDLFASRPFIVHGRYKAGGTGTITIRGTVNGRPTEIPLQVTLPESEPDNQVLETLWARARIDSLDRLLWSGQDPQVVDDITALGIDYRIVTAYTSFVAVDRSKKVAGGGSTPTVVQPVEAPEGVNAQMAAPAAAFALADAPSAAPFGGAGTGFGAARKEASIPARALPMAEAAKVPLVALDSEDEDAEESPAEKADPTRPVVIHMVAGTVDGTISPKLIESVLRRRLILARRCLGSQAGTTGKLTLRVELDDEQRVKRITVVEDTTGEAAVVACFERALRRLAFPDGVKAFTWTFELR